MENYQSILLAEMEAQQRQARLLEAADSWQATGDLPEEPALRERLADALIAVAVWLAPQRAEFGPPQATFLNTSPN